MTEEWQAWLATSIFALIVALLLYDRLRRGSKGDE